MLTLGNDLRISGEKFVLKPTVIEQIQPFLEGKTQDRISVQEAIKTLQFRLDRLKSKTKLLKNVDLSDQVLKLIEN